MSARMFRGNEEITAIDPGNRGLNYGDGLFETMRVHRGGTPLWPRHAARLRDGARRLGIAMPAIETIQARAAEMIEGMESGVLKLLLTRGDAGRGYAPPGDAEPVWMLSRHPLPAPPASGLRLHWCDIRLAAQPALAGIKHCNRLEQILARAETGRAGCDEGLMRDAAGAVIGATSANLLVLRDGRWRTPRIDACGVAGVLRGWLLEQRLADTADLAPGDVESGDAVALCNAVRGILPVASLETRAWARHPALDELQGRLAMAYPMFSDAGASA